MKLFFISIAILSKSLFAMGDPQFIPANPPSTKSLPDIADLRKKTAPNGSQQAQEEKEKKKIKKEEHKTKQSKENL